MLQIVAYRHACPDLDLANISFKPSEDQPLEKNPLPFAAVTAACDNIKLFQRLDPTKDAILTGNVTWVGRSSMVCQYCNFYLLQEVLLTVDARTPSGTLEKVIQAYFTMVARETSQVAAVTLPPLGIISSEEKIEFDDATGNSSFCSLLLQQEN